MKELNVTLTEEMLDGHNGNIFDCTGARALRTAFGMAHSSPDYSKYDTHIHWGVVDGYRGELKYESYMDGQLISMTKLTKADIGKEITFKLVEK